MIWLLSALAWAWPLQGPTGPVGEVDPASVLHEAPFDPATIRSDPADLALVAADLLRWRAAHPDEAGKALLGTVDPTPTLEWIVRIAAEDQGKPVQRLRDPAFLASELRFVAWTPDVAGAAKRGIQLPPDQIRKTAYLAWAFDGVRTKDAAHPCALYGVPRDEADLARYTRKEVLDGAYEPGGTSAGGAEPLAWLTRAQVHEALMQGTVVIRFPDGGQKTLNVYRNNGRTWNPAFAREPERQDRLWYFREVDGLRGYGTEDKVHVQPQVTVAGDVANLGLGPLVALRWTEGGQDRVQLVLLADNGGAFAPNLFQLDWLVGIYEERAEFDQAARAIPDRVEAGFLVVR